jgi:PTS system mannose-specific IIA component
MIGVVLVTHGHLADEFRLAVEHVVGPQENFATVCIGADDDMERRRADIVEAVAAVDTGAGVIILTDMFGGTPSNLAISVMRAGSVEVIAGVNLPMLIKLTSRRRRWPGANISTSPARCSAANERAGKSRRHGRGEQGIAHRQQARAACARLGPVRPARRRL